MDTCLCHCYLYHAQLKLIDVLICSFMNRRRWNVPIVSLRSDKAANSIENLIFPAQFSENWWINPTQTFFYFLLIFSIDKIIYEYSSSIQWKLVNESNWNWFDIEMMFWIPVLITTICIIGILKLVDVLICSFAISLNHGCGSARNEWKSCN